MKVNTIALAILSTFSIGAYANNAVLNVEGQIQINGQTVIGTDGKVVANALPSSSGVAINLDKYGMQLGVYTYQYTDMYNSDLTCTDVDRYISDSSYEYSGECKDSSDNAISGYSSTWVDNGDGTETDSWTDFYGNSGTQTKKVEVLTDYDSLVTIGTTTSYLERSTIESTTSEWGQVGDESFYSRTKTVVGLIESVEVAGKTYRDCILMANVRNWSRATDLDMYCADVGLVAQTSNSIGQNYRLVSFEPNNTRSTQSLNSQSYSGSDKTSADKARAEMQKARSQD